MIDNFDCEQVVIRQYIKLRLEKTMEKGGEAEIQMLPFQIYQYCKSIFRREGMVNAYLFGLFKEIFYLKDLQGLKEARSDQLSNLYLKLLSEQASKKAVLISQINLRFILLALSIKIAKKDTSFFKRTFKDYIQQLQLELILNTQEVLSDVIVKQLDGMATEFHDLEYYEHLKLLFQKLQIDKVAQWVQGQLDLKRTIFEQKQQNTLPFKLEQKELQGKSTKKIPAKSNLKQMVLSQTTEGNVQNNSSKQGQSILKSKTSEKNRKIKESAMNQRGSCISLANKLRKSMPGSSGRYSCKYVFKSTKKNQSQQVVYEDEEENKSPSINEAIQNYPTKIHLSTPVNRQQSEDQNSKFLCAATPPRRNFRVLDEN